MAVPTYSTTCLATSLIAPQVYELRFSKPAGFTFEAGQFVLFDVPSVTDPADVQPRAYSIASAPGEEDLLFVIKLVPHGRASAWVEHTLVPGKTVMMKGPFGALRLDVRTQKPYLFIATGTGIAPFRSQIVFALRQMGDSRPMQLVAGVPRPEDFFWQTLWQSLEERYPNFHAHGSFLSGEADWHGERGTVQEWIRALLKETSAVSVYICGAPDIVSDIVRLATSFGVQKNDIHTEKYI